MLPIQAVFADIQSKLSQHANLIIQAPPGAGKSTWLPLALLNLKTRHQSQFNDGKIILLEPRRVAARNIATFLAQQLGENVGQRIGLRMRGETKVSANTQLEVITEGVLTRILQSDPELSDYQLILFDEFHERSLQSDLAFVLTQQVQQALRDDLQIVIMSATLDLATLERILPDTPIVKSDGRQFPIEFYYRPLPKIQNRGYANPYQLENHLLSVIKEALQFPGDILVFLAGVNEINRAQQVISSAGFDKLKLVALHGRLSLAEQQQALLADNNGLRKIVFSTNIAETSLTIANIRIVIDSGLHKTVKFDPKTDFNQLVTERISQASSIQRAGRAGRVDSGICFRLWTETEQNRLTAQYPAEIEQADLSQLVFEVKIWGENDLTALNWPTPPRQTQLLAAMQKLKNWHLLNNDNQLTQKAKKLTHYSGDLFSALLEQPLYAKQHNAPSALISLLSSYFMDNKTNANWDLSEHLISIARQVNHPIKQQAEQKLKRKIRMSEIDIELAQLACLLVPLWPQRVAKLRRQSESGAIYIMANGTAVELKQANLLTIPEFLLIVDAGFIANQANGVIYSAIEVKADEFNCLVSDYCSEEIDLEIDKKSGSLKFYQQQRLFNLLLSRQALTQQPTKQQIKQAWLTQLNESVINNGYHASVLNETQQLALQNLIARWNNAAQFYPQFKVISLDELVQSASDWLSIYLTGIQSLTQFNQLNLAKLWLEQQDYQLQQLLTQLCPIEYLLADGRSVKINYLAQAGATISGYMQSFYGMTKHPSIMQDKQALVVELISPARRPIQTTCDLPNFWQGSYRLVQKEMKAEYPKHFWPDNPASASAGTATKRQRQVN